MRPWMVTMLINTCIYVYSHIYVFLMPSVFMFMDRDGSPLTVLELYNIC